MTRRLIFLLAAIMGHVAHSFAPSAPLSSSSHLAVVPRTSIQNFHFINSHKNPLIQFMATDSDEKSSDETLSTSIASSSLSSARSLEEKMKSWEASEEEIKAATLGGMVPGTRIGAGASGESAGRADAFDVGLYIAFPIMILSCLAFIFFPLLVGNIDITSVGPPPTS